ncbi:MAG: PQQ-binding-like beta-propeller repeat protein [Maricaulaceae bacterium]
MNKFLITLGLVASVSLSGCATLGNAVDAVNPFDETEAEKKARQGEVAGGNERISILALDDTLTLTEGADPASIVLPAPYVNADWPQPGGASTHVVQHTAATGPLEKIWSKNMGDGSGRKGRVVAPPVISDGKLVVMDGRNTVQVVDLAFGNKVWEHRLTIERGGRTRTGKTGIIERIRDPLSVADDGGADKESVGGGITTAGGVVYVTSGLGVIEALDLATGASIWRKESRVPMHSAPTASGGRLFALTDDNELIAYNASTGDVLWTYQGIIENARMLTAPSPAVVDEVVIAPFASGEIVALRVQNGSVLWQDALSSSGRLTPLATLNDIAAGPIIADGYVIATAQSGSMSAFDLRTGQRIWSQPAGSLGYPWLAGDIVYTVTTEGQVAAISKLDGAVLWIKQLEAFKNEKKRKKRIAWAGPILAGERLLVFSSRGEAIEMNPYTGDIKREFSVGDAVFVPPIIANETIYILTDDAKVVALK